ncbi:MAG: ATP synthase F1 subunit delta [Lachnospiraceae bacterium]|nr:ATP synthase F1 subunit delta [Lachnospiraceae bacterium]
MTQTANNYGKVLYNLGISREIVEETKRIFSLTTELPKVLDSPVVTLKEKERLIDVIFPEEIRNFLKVLCDYGSVNQIADIFIAYESCVDAKSHTLRATLYYVTLPTDSQLAQIKKYLVRKYNQKEVQVKLVEQPDLIGGFVIRVKDEEEDWSMKGRLNKLQQKLVWR